MDDRDWDRLITQLIDGECTPFLGAGACHGFLPNGSDLSRRWARRYNYPFVDDHDLPRVMQFATIAERGDAVHLKQRLCNELSAAGLPDFTDPVEPHALLAEFPIRTFITTNYDQFLIKALQSKLKRPKHAICPWFASASADYQREYFADVPSDRPLPQEPLVFYLHGSIQTPKSLVLSEADYLEFLVNITASREGDGPRLIPSVVLAAMADNPLLFIGYSLEDWTFRVLFHGLLRDRAEVLRRRSFSVQLLPPVSGSVADAERRAEDYLTRYLEGWHISIFWGTAEEFCTELRSRLS
jgi:hypothetical protein